jgi:hypothetical protein
MGESPAMITEDFVLNRIQTELVVNARPTTIFHSSDSTVCFAEHGTAAPKNGKSLYLGGRSHSTIAIACQI